MSHHFQASFFPSKGTLDGAAIVLVQLVDCKLPLVIVFVVVSCFVDAGFVVFHMVFHFTDAYLG